MYLSQGECILVVVAAGITGLCIAGEETFIPLNGSG